MTPAEQQHKELMGLIMRGMCHVLTYAERNRFAELAGFFRGKGRPPKAASIRATDQDFENPERFKLLCEKAIGRPIHQLPKWDAHRPKGSKCSDAKRRQAERYRLECEALRNDPQCYNVRSLFDRAIHDGNIVRTESAYYSALSAFRRDLAQGHQQAVSDTEQQAIIAGIAESIRKTYNSHK